VSTAIYDAVGWAPSSLKPNAAIPQKFYPGRPSLSWSNSGTFGTFTKKLNATVSAL